MLRASLIALALSFALRAQDLYTGPKALGPFLIDNYGFPLQRLFKLLGAPSVLKSDLFCYESTDGKASLWIERMASGDFPSAVGTLMVSQFHNCTGRPRKAAQLNPADWRTERGVGLGSTIAELRKAHGKPTEIRQIDPNEWLVKGTTSPHKLTPDAGEKAWIYSGGDHDLRLAIFGFRDGKIAWIVLSHNE